MPKNFFKNVEVALRLKDVVFSSPAAQTKTTRRIVWAQPWEGSQVLVDAFPHQKIHGNYVYSGSLDRWCNVALRVKWQLGHHPPNVPWARGACENAGGDHRSPTQTSSIVKSALDLPIFHRPPFAALLPSLIQDCQAREALCPLYATLSQRVQNPSISPLLS